MAFKKFDEWEKIYEKYIYKSDKEIPGAELVGIIDDRDFETVNRIKGELNSSVIEKHLEKIFINNNIPLANLNELLDIFKKYLLTSEQINMLAEIVKGENYEIDTSTGLNTETVNNIAGYYNNKYNVPRNLFIEINKLSSTGQSGTGIGKGEFLMAIFTQLKNSVDAGDLVLGNEGIEVKGPRGRFKGQYNTRVFSDVKKSWTEIFTKYNLGLNVNDILKGKSISQTAFSDNRDFIDKIIEHPQSNELISDIIESLYSRNDTRKPVKSDIETFKNALTNSVNDIRAFIISIHLYEYSKREKFKYIMFFDRNYEKIYLINFQSFKNITEAYQYLRNFDLEVAGWADTPRESAFGIKIK